jgi:signal transduction histidine kinase/CheY-like chemotaxis protein
MMPFDGQDGRLASLVGLAAAVAAGRPPDAVLATATAEARRLTGAHFAVGRVLAGEELVVTALACEDGDLGGVATVPTLPPLRVGHGLDGCVAAARAPLRLDQVADERRQAGGLPPAVTARLCGYLGVPVMVQERLIGTLSVGATRPTEFTGDDVTLLVGLAAHAAAAVERAELTRDLLHAQRLAAVGELVAGVAHELNNPLAAVVGTADLLRLRPLDGRIGERLERISIQAQRAGKIVRALLTLARQTAPEWTLVDLNALLDDVVELCAYELRRARVSVARRFSRSLPQIVADPVQLQQVFTNLCLNACEAMHEAHGEGVLTLATRWDPAEGRAVVDVSDDGPGIAPSHVDRVFEPFFTTKRGGKGMGLGLAICRRLVEHHGGVLAVESRSETGVTFTVALPERREAPTVGTPDPEERTPARGALAVLLVEDDTVVGDLLTEFLAVDGHAVDRAVDGGEALDRLRQRSYDLIVTDIHMPDVDGATFYRALQEIAPALARRVVFVTGDVMRPETQTFLAESGLAYLEKPFDLGQFRALVRSAVQQSDAADDAGRAACTRSAPAEP